MANDGTSFEIDLPVRDGGAKTAAEKLALLADRMTQYEAATLAATNAVKAAEAAYKVAETTADRHAKAVEKVNLAIEAQRGKIAEAIAAEGIFSDRAEKASAVLAKLTQRQGEATTKAEQAKAALAEQGAALDKLRAAAVGAANKEEEHAKALGKARAAALAAEDAMARAAGTGNAKKLAGALGDIGGPVGSFGQKVALAADTWGDFKETLGAAGPYVAISLAIMAIVTAVAALTAAAIAGTVSIAAWAVGLGDAARSQRLLADGIAGSVEGGAMLEQTFRAIESQIPISREELEKMAGELKAAGKSGEELTASLQTAAVKAAELKFGPDFAKQMLSLDVQSKRLQRNFAGIFGGLKIEGLLKAIAKLVALFEETSVTGNAIKVVFESLFQPLVDGVEGFVPKMVSAFIQFEILVLKALIAIKPFGSKIVLVGQAFAILAAIIVGVVALAFALFIAPLVIIAGLLTAAIAIAIEFGSVLADVAEAIVSGPVFALDFFVEKLEELFEWLSGKSLSDVGSAMMQGLADGITGAAGAVLTAMKGAVTGAVTSAKSLLGISSPSKLLHDEIGAPMGQGIAGGIEGEGAGVQSALETITTPTPIAPAPIGGGGAGLGGATFNLNFYGVAGAQEAIEDIKIAVTRIIEGDVAQLGGAEPA